MAELRIDGRTAQQLRPLKVTFSVYEYAAGSVLFELGKTKVLCAVTLTTTVPPFLKNTRTGWLTAEYALLPTSTQIRTQRESATKLSGRSVEISRLIGRSLRAIVKLDKFGERTINIDCDVLQADGGTRTASITGAYLALQQAEKHWLEQGIISEPILRENVAAISVGMVNGKHLLDLNAQEDTKADIDLNFVLTRSHKLVELQGTAEGNPVSWDDFEIMRHLATQGIGQIFQFFATLS